MRKPGYYWIRLRETDKKLRIAQYYAPRDSPERGAWFFMGLESSFSEEEIHEISAKPIPIPRRIKA